MPHESSLRQASLFDVFQSRRIVKLARHHYRQVHVQRGGCGLAGHVFMYLHVTAPEVRETERGRKTR